VSEGVSALKKWGGDTRMFFRHFRLLLCVAAWCSVLQCVAVCCSVLQRVDTRKCSSVISVGRAISCKKLQERHAGHLLCMYIHL